MNSAWPTLDYHTFKPTLTNVHQWCQIVGKVRLKQMPWLNHSWHVTLYISPSGLTTGSMPYQAGLFQIELNFITHQLLVSTSAGKSTSFGLGGYSVAEFYAKFRDALQAVDLNIAINGSPNELEHAISFAENHQPGFYDGFTAHNYWQALLQVNNVFTKFRAGFSGKCSPVHFFWGAFDLAVTRFSGRKAPLHPGGAPNIPLKVMQEAYSHEVSSCGFWPGDDNYPEAAFYSYCYPTPAAFGKQPVQLPEAFYNSEMGEFILPYEAVRKADNPEAALLSFMRSTYNVAAKTGNWDSDLECDLNYLKQ